MSGVGVKENLSFDIFFIFWDMGGSKIADLRCLFREGSLKIRCFDIRGGGVIKGQENSDVSYCRPQMTILNMYFNNIQEQFGIKSRLLWRNYGTHCISLNNVSL